MKKKIVLNSHSSGKFERKVINGRDHLVTQVVSVELGSVMNGLFYGSEEVKSSITGLKNILAPASHPTVGGANVSAFHPLAINNNHVGAFILNSSIVDDFAISDLAIDVDFANKSDDGKAVVDRVEKGERFGVSTGLNATVVNQSGVARGREYHGVVTNIEYDHLAILLSETPAGEKTFSINDEEIIVCNVRGDLSELHQKLRALVQAKFPSEDFVFIETVHASPDFVIAEVDNQLFKISFGYDGGEPVLTGEPIKVERKVTFEPTETTSQTNHREVNEMDQSEFAMELVVNGHNSFTSEDRDRLSSMSTKALAIACSNATVKSTVTIDEATAVIEAAGLQVNNITAVQNAEYLAAKPELDAMRAEKEAQRNGLIESLVNSKAGAAADFEGLSTEVLTNLNAKFCSQPANYSVRAATVTNANKSVAPLQLAEGA
ncbi:DUF2213 domain-containing protein [Candidatus Pacearchaeota archaeon]|nr:DUF2213 domain-containing protein [Candidatus Pacearchaeota archaeon]